MASSEEALILHSRSKRHLADVLLAGAHAWCRVADGGRSVAARPARAELK